MINLILERISARSLSNCKLHIEIAHHISRRTWHIVKEIPEVNRLSPEVREIECGAK